MTERFMIDDAGTLIDMQTRDMFDIVEEVCPLLNELNEENKQLKLKLNTMTAGNKTLKTTLNNTRNLIKEAYETERTELGRSVLRQLRDRIQ